MARTLKLYVASSSEEQPGEGAMFWQIVHSADEVVKPKLVTSELTHQLINTCKEIEHVTCIFPTEWVTTLSLQLPKMRKRLLASSLPYAMEERLSEPLENYACLPMVFGEKSCSSAIAIDLELLRSWCRWLDDMFPHSSSAILVDGWLLPRAKSKIAMAQYGERFLIHYGDKLCIATHESSKDLVINALKHTGDKSQADVQNVVFKTTEEFVESLFSWAHDYRDLNLRQGEFAAPTKKTLIDILKPALVGLLVGSVLITTSNLASVRVIEKKTAEIKQMTSTLYKTTFGSEGMLVNPVVQARSALELLELQVPVYKNEMSVLDLLLGTMSCISRYSQVNQINLISIRSVDSGTKVSLEIEAAELGILNDLTEHINTYALKARLLSAVETDGMFLARLSIAPDQYD
ncbi:MAG: type II secretion system protein GspL [Halioglobus sp.]